MNFHDLIYMQIRLFKKMINKERELNGYSTQIRL